MKVLFIRLVVVATLTLGSAAYALPTQAASPAAALHINAFDCVGFDGDGNLGGAAGTVSREVIRSSGNLVLKCKFLTTPSSTGHAVVWDFANTGIYCSAEGPERLTSITRETVSASGQAVLTCQFKPGIQL